MYALALFCGQIEQNLTLTSFIHRWLQSTLWLLGGITTQSLSIHNVVDGLVFLNRNGAQVKMDIHLHRVTAE